MKNHFVICECESSEHTLRFIYDEDQDENYDHAVHTEVYLNHHRSVFKRIWVAIKYIFGYTSKYGHFDCTEIGKMQRIKLRDFLSTTIK